MTSEAQFRENLSFDDSFEAEKQREPHKVRHSDTLDPFPTRAQSSKFCTLSAT